MNMNFFKDNAMQMEICHNHYFLAIQLFVVDNGIKTKALTLIRWLHLCQIMDGK